MNEWGITGDSRGAVARKNAGATRRLAIALLGGAVIGCGAFAPVSVAVAQTKEPNAQQALRFSIPAQPLSSAVDAFSRVSGWQVGYSSKIARDTTTRAVSGAMAPAQALQAMLAGTNIRVRLTGQSSAALVDASEAANSGVDADGSTMLSPIVIEGQSSAAALQSDGLAADGYRADRISSLGPLGATSLKDTPFSVSVVPHELLQNIQAQSPDDVFRVNPSTRTSTPQISGWAPMVNIRGFSTYDTAWDGLRRAYSHATVLEDVERVEVLNGLSGFFYGASAPGGMVNYVSKRPTQERYNSVTVGTYGAGQAYVHGDFGGPINQDGSLGYRINIVKQAGDTAIDDQNINRGLISGAFDWQVTDQLKLELNTSYSKYKTENSSTWWSYSIPHGDVPDPEKNWGQKWIRDEFEKKKAELRATYELNDSITLRGAYSKEYINRPVQDHIMNAVASPGEYTQVAIHSGRTKDEFDAAQILADLTFDTGSISHKITTGYQMYSDKQWGTPYSPNTGWLGPFPLSSPTYLPYPTFPIDQSTPYYAGRVQNQNFVIGDQVELTERLTMLAGATYSKIQSVSYDSGGSLSSPRYDQGRWSPSTSLIYKITPTISIYGSYIEGLEQGGVAPDGTLNNGMVMAPMISRQKEIGIKAEVSEVLLTAALFDIEKAYEFVNSENIYTQNGRQNHRGIELTATGKVTDNLTLLGGITLLNAKVKGGDYDGNAPTDVAKVLAKLYAEYEVPRIEGLVLTGGIQHTGKQWADDVNTDRLSAYTTFDLGARYTTTAYGDPLTVRFGVTNVANKAYWQNSHYIGAPRTVAFSIQKQF